MNATNPTDFEIKGMIHRMWHSHLNLEILNISLCLASKLRVEYTDEFQAYVHTRIKAMVKKGDLRRQKFLPGRPYYTIS